MNLQTDHLLLPDFINDARQVDKTLREKFGHADA
jgi:hypothetical protein